MPKMKRKDSGPAVLGSDRVRALSPIAEAACVVVHWVGRWRWGGDESSHKALSPERLKSTDFDMNPINIVHASCFHSLNVSAMLQVVFVPLGVLSSPLRPHPASPLPFYSSPLCFVQIMSSSGKWRKPFSLPPTYRFLLPLFLADACSTLRTQLVDRPLAMFGCPLY